jgi:hypothetical protein
MELENLIRRLTKAYGITRAQLFDKTTHACAQPRRELAYLARQSGFNYVDLENVSGISRTAWNKAYRLYEVRTKIDPESVKEIADRKDAERKKSKQISLGFEFSVVDEIKMENAIRCAIEFMKSYGKGYSPTTSYGRIINNMDAYQKGLNKQTLDIAIV